MRKVIFVVPVLLLLGWLGYQQFWGPPDARTILERAIKAHGGAKNLERSRIGLITGHGKRAYAHGIYLPFAFEETFVLPSKLKRLVKSRDNGDWVTTRWLFRDGRRWLAEGDAEPEVTEVEPSSLESIGSFLLQLLDIRRDKLDMKAIGETDVKGRPAQGIQVAQDGKVNLYFDKEIGLLVKMSKRLRDPEGESVQIEVYYSDPKEADGVVVPRSVLYNHDGQKNREVTITEVQYFDRLEDSVFEKP